MLRRCEMVYVYGSWIKLRSIKISITNRYKCSFYYRCYNNVKWSTRLLGPRPLVHCKWIWKCNHDANSAVTLSREQGIWIQESYPSKFEFVFLYRQASGFGFFPQHSVLKRPSTDGVWRQYQWIRHRYKPPITTQLNKHFSKQANTVKSTETLTLLAYFLCFNI